MRRYETLIVLHPELPEAQTRETVDRIKKLIEGMGGECHQVQEWGMRELAFHIRKQSRGYYVLAEYSSKPDVVRELERTLKIGDEFLRFVTVVSSGAPQQKERPARAKRPESRPEKMQSDEDAEPDLAGMEE